MLAPASLDNNPVFEALSYVWGDATVRKPVHVGGQVFNVTANLESALRALRQEDVSRTIWADAICIDQTNVAEKNHQIPLMGRIYSQASAVLVWLDNPTMCMRKSFEWMESQTKGLDRKKEENDTLSRKTNRERLEFSAACHGFSHIFLHTYFHRMWTFQEYHLARTDPVFVCGKLAFRASSLVAGKQRAIEQARTHLWGNETPWGLNDVDLELDAELQKQWEQDQEWERNQNPRLAHEVTGGHGFRESDLLTLLEATSSRRCTDPRDRIYALYGLCPAAAEAVPADYNRPVGKVRHEIMVHLMQQKIFSLAGALESFWLNENRFDSIPRCPSWVPDFLGDRTDMAQLAKPDFYVTHRNLHDSVLEGMYEDPLPTLTGHDMGILRLSGRILGECRVLHRFDRDDDDRVVSEIESLKQSTGSYDFLAPSTSGLPPDCRLQSVLEAHVPKGSNFEEKLSALRGKTIFLTPRGQPGISVGSMQDGDIIVVSLFLVRPVVLRLDQHSNGRLYRMVGLGYVEGLMNDEFFDQELGKVVLSQGYERFDVV